MTPISTKPSPTRWTSPPSVARRSDAWPRITSRDLLIVREPLPALLERGRRTDREAVIARLAAAAAGPVARDWPPPVFLLPHQRDAARRAAGSLAAFGLAVLADAVGLGKTYTALALATRYRTVTAVVPAALVEQWRRTAASLGMSLRLVSHERLSRGGTLEAAELVIVDEAHRFRNGATRRYAALARGVGAAHVLLVTATPVVNRAGDLAALLSLGLPDRGLAPLGVASLERATRERRLADLARATASLCVARSHRVVRSAAGSVPRPRDRPVAALPPVTIGEFERLIDAVGALRFPNIGDACAAELLRLHLYTRLASSAAALRETLRRHLGYLDRARAAARRGEALSRGSAWQLFRDLGEPQLELDLPVSAMVARADTATLDAERTRVVDLLGAVPAGPHCNPKAARLLALLARRRRRRTIVFVTAATTARDLAARAGWRHVAVVAAGTARIATGAIPVEHALDLFAPVARRARHPPASQRVDTLIATDLVSEGLDLQDADAIVHYDLPWTPLRLIQRLGRIARLGSEHREARVWWFAPPAALDRRMRLAERIASKARDQAVLGTAVTSTVGTARRFGAEAEARESLNAMGARGAAGPASEPEFVVVKGPAVGIVALVALVHGVWVPELVLVGGPFPDAPGHFQCVRRLLERLGRSRESSTPPPGALLAELSTIVRARVRAADSGSVDGASRALARRVIRRAREAGRRRAHREIAVLDGALARIHAGLRRGALWELADRLDRGAPVSELADWMRRHSLEPSGRFEVWIAAALFGDGSVRV